PAKKLFTKNEPPTGQPFPPRHNHLTVPAATFTCRTSSQNHPLATATRLNPARIQRFTAIATTRRGAHSMLMRVGISVVALVLAFLGSASPQSAPAQEKTVNNKAAQEGVVHTDVDLVSVYFTVRDNHKRLVNDLPQDKFSVSEDGRPQAVKFFAH